MTADEKARAGGPDTGGRAGQRSTKGAFVNVGSVIENGGRCYTQIRKRRKFTYGRWCVRFVWEGRCATCGLPFWFVTGPTFPRTVNRRCPRHHAPGRPAPQQEGAS